MSHYIRLDSKNRIIDGFSDAFESPKPGDVCILDDPQQRQRQFMLNNQYNPPLFDMFRFPLYKYVNGVVMSVTADDNTDLIAAQKAAEADMPPTDSQRIDMMQSVLDNLLMGGTTNG